MSARGVFVTGTDTGVGKTVASCALIHALRARGVPATPFKPIAAGAVERDGRWVNEDTLALMEAAGLDASAAERVTPVLLREPMAPHIAAQREGRTITLEPIRSAFDTLGGFVVAEGVGGFRVPLADGLDSVDLCRELGLPVVLVVGLRLGCLNHALLTAQAIRAAGVPFAGWIANAIDPAMAAADENVAALEARLDAPLLGRLPREQALDPARLARHLDLSTLVARG
jgi:dethiobiotin synthetase